jgi:hypothetical protein
VRIFTTKRVNKAERMGTVEVALIDPNASQDRISEILGNNRRKSPDDRVDLY